VNGSNSFDGPRLVLPIRASLPVDRQTIAPILRPLSWDGWTVCVHCQRRCPTGQMYCQSCRSKP
jgi:hypothetical protein